mgnify:CR=1 FL=1
MTQVVNTPLSAFLRGSSENIDWDVSKLAHPNQDRINFIANLRSLWFASVQKSYRVQLSHFFNYAILVYLI